MSIAARQGRIREELRGQGLDALVVTDLVNIRYLSGFVGSNGVLVVGSASLVLLTDSRYATAARDQVTETDVVIAGRAYDPAVFAALPILRGFDPALALHLGKVLECSYHCK